MDIQRTIPTKPLWHKYWYILPLLLLIIGGYYFTHMFAGVSYIVDKNQVVTAQVEQGNFSVNVRATGVLKPLNIRWVSAQVSGRVEQILVKAGSLVKKGDVLAILSAAELPRELEKIHWQLIATKAENHAAYVSLELQLLDLNNAITAAELNYQSAKLKLDAESALMAQGNATVSSLDYKKSQLLVKQQLQSWRAQQQKAEKMKATMQATKTAQQARISLLENSYQQAKERVDALQIIAQTSGVVQQVSLTLGQRAQLGESVALIADQKMLFAQLQVQELRAQDVLLGQRVTIDTRSNSITGAVTRISPAVKGGMVEIDVALSGNLPTEARPDLSVDGLIEISNFDNALFVKRPVFAPRFSQAGLYKISSDQQFARKQLVKFGQSSVNKIQIVSGLKVGDKVIISDTTDWQEHQQIMLN